MTPLKNIVVIDPEEFIRQLLGEYFEQLGYTVNSAALVSEGLEIISSQNAEVVLIDTGSTSNKNSLEAVDRLREARPGLKVVLITGYPTLDGVINAVRKGVFDIVVKPFRLEDLKETVNRACQPSAESETANQLRNRIRRLESLLEEHGIKIPNDRIAPPVAGGSRMTSSVFVNDPVDGILTTGDSDSIHD